MSTTHQAETAPAGYRLGLDHKLDLSNFPYLQRLERLQNAYPALRSLLNKLRNYHLDEGRRLVSLRYSSRHWNGGSPGRVAVVSFLGDNTTHEIYDSAESLRHYFADSSTQHQQDGSSPRRRLFILEDMEPSMVDVLGSELGVNPLIFSEQMNTWNSTDSQSIPFRSLASQRSPKTLFTLRYYEIRTLDDGDSVRTDKNQMTHAVNRRKIERWRDVDLPSVVPDKRHALVRRCMSFWTSEANENIKPDSSWDALILVDPPMDSCGECERYSSTASPGDKSELQISIVGRPESTCLPLCLMLEDPESYQNERDLWNSRSWDSQDARGQIREVRHNSVAYHGGCVSLARPSFTDATGLANLALLEEHRHSASAMDEMIFHLTKYKHPQRDNAKSLDTPVNAAHYMLNFVTQHWAHQLDLIADGVGNAERFADDHGTPLDSRSSLQKWKNELSKIASATKDINYMRRQLTRYDLALTLNMERVGVKIHQAVDETLPCAILNAQEDFLTVASRLRPLRERVDALTSIANEVASLRAAFKSIQDGEQSLWLSLFAAVIFPLTLVASILSMNDGYLPGQGHFWVFWAASVPLALVIGVFMLGRRPAKLIRTMWRSSPALSRRGAIKQQHKTSCQDSV